MSLEHIATVQEVSARRLGLRRYFIVAKFRKRVCEGEQCCSHVTAEDWKREAANTARLFTVGNAFP